MNDKPDNSKSTQHDEKKKVFVLDTNILINDPPAFLRFGANDVHIPVWVIDELDKFKKGLNGNAHASRTASRLISKYTSTGDSVKDGVDLGNGGKLFLGFCRPNILKRYGLEDTVDNKILAYAESLVNDKKNYKDRQIVIVTEDRNMQIKASGRGIRAEFLKSGRVDIAIDDLALPRIKISPKKYEDFLTSKKMQFSLLCKRKKLIPYHNIICFLECSGKESIPVIIKKEGKVFNFLPRNFVQNIGGIAMKNDVQRMAASLLVDERLFIFAFLGKTGGGKTFLALLDAYEEVIEKRKQSQILVYRTNHVLGRDVGALPGDLDEKFSVWKEPIISCLEMIIREKMKNSRHKELLLAFLDENRAERVLDNKKDRSRNKNKKKSETKETNNFPMNPRSLAETLIQRKVVHILPISYIRGYTFHNKIVILDEGQNANTHEMLSFLTRIGSDSKIIITGDISQIDNIYVDENSNGLSHAIDSLRGEDYFAYIQFEKSERSEIADKIANRW